MTNSVIKIYFIASIMFINSSFESFCSSPSSIEEKIISAFTEFPINTQFSIAIVDGEDVEYYGYIKHNDGVEPVNNKDKIFEIGSIAKVFTSTLLAQLVEDGKLYLTDNININYPFTFKNNINLKFIELANHTSGLPRLPENLDLLNEANPYKTYGKNEINHYLQFIMSLKNEPSTTYTYSNLGGGLLGYTLGLSQNSNYNDLLENKILNKYNLKNTYTTIKGIENRLVSGLNAKGDIVSNWEFDVFTGSGGVLSTTYDLARFAIAHFNQNDEVLSLTRKSTFKVNNDLEIGLGWHILKSDDDRKIFSHNGGTGGYTSSMSIDIDNNKAIIILTNATAFSSFSGKINDLLYQLLD